MPRGILEETICHHPGGFSRKEELQEELEACTKASARLRKLGLPCLGQEQLFLRKGRIRTSALDFFNDDQRSAPLDGEIPELLGREDPALQVFKDPMDDFQAPPVGLEQIDVPRPGPRERPFALEEVQLDQPGRRSVEIPIHSPEEAKVFAANYAVASHTPVDVDLDKNEIVPDDPSQAPVDQPEEEVQYWVMEGSDGSGPVVVHHEHHVSHGHHDHGHVAGHHGKDGMSYSHEETITTGNGVNHGQGHMTVRHHIVHRVHEHEPQRQRFVPPPPPPDDDMRLLDEPQVEPLQPKIVLGGLLAIFAQVYLWGNVFVTLFKPNRSPNPAPGAAPLSSPTREEVPAAQPPLVLFGAGGAVGEARSTHEETQTA